MSRVVIQYSTIIVSIFLFYRDEWLHSLKDSWWWEFVLLFCPFYLFTFFSLNTKHSWNDPVKLGLPLHRQNTVPWYHLTCPRIPHSDTSDLSPLCRIRPLAWTAQTTALNVLMSPCLSSSFSLCIFYSSHTPIFYSQSSWMDCRLIIALVLESPSLSFSSSPVSPFFPLYPIIYFFLSRTVSFPMFCHNSRRESLQL